MKSLIAIIKTILFIGVSALMSIFIVLKPEIAFLVLAPVGLVVIAFALFNDFNEANNS